MLEARRRALALLVIAILLGGAATYGLYSYVQSMKAQYDQMVSVVVAAKPIPMHSTIEPAMLKTVQMPLRYAPKGLYIKPDGLKDKASLVPVKEGEPLTTSMVDDALNLPGDKRRVGFNLGDKIWIDPAVQPGDLVDAVASYNTDKGSVVKLVQTNISVQAVDTQGRVIMLELDGEQAQQLLWLADFGTRLRFLKANVVGRR